MPDFSQLLSKPAGESRRPPTLPAGDYPAIIKSFEYGDNNTNRTPYVRFAIGLTDWDQNVPDSWSQADAQGNLTEVSKSDVDLSRRQLRRDYFLTDDAYWRLDELILSCGVVPNGRSYEEVIPELVGSPVLAEVQQYLNQRSNETGNQIGRLTGTSRT